jgi:DNA (cytosine-5)-methyltransferase 1
MFMSFRGPDYQRHHCDLLFAFPFVASYGRIRLQMTTGSFTVLDLFCGAGGLSLGFRRVDFVLVLAIDNNSAALETYKNSFGPHATSLDLSKPADLPKCDVIVGGPPCQGFSSAGMRRNGDQRNNLVSAFASIIANLRPNAFVFENVEGFLTAENGGRVLDLLGPLLESGYRIHLRKINAANYGVPQHRKRVIGIGGLGWDPTFPAPTHTAFGAPGALLHAKHLPLTPTVMNAIGDLPNPAVEPPGVPVGHFTRPLTAMDLARAQALEPGMTMRDIPESLQHDSYRRRAFRRVMDGTPSERRGGAPAGLRRLRPDEPSKAITGGARSEFLHPIADRNLTIRECARLQTFPDDFLFAGNSAEQAQLIGNAVPPLFGEVLAKTLAADLQTKRLQFEQGALLSFVPTLSEGCSPALRQTATLVKDKFHRYIETEELPLWR